MGIYVHVPFCRSKCFYCGFYSVASLAMKKVYLDALEREIEMRRGYLSDNLVETLYFGGGTPSILEIGELERVTKRLTSVYTFCAGAEWTIEMNPEDLTREKLEGYKKIGFNRISVGVQSFSDKILKIINRRHSGLDALEGIWRAAEMGFENISIDLIVGLPGQSLADIRQEVKIVCELPVQHVSVYMLSVEPGTVFEHRLHRGEFKMLEEDVVIDFFQDIGEALKSNGFERYEISNFAKNGKYSRHNTSYWQQKPYIGFGPSAHSYNCSSRQWNVSQLKVYAEAIAQGCLATEREILTSVDLYNEYVMTNLRTMWGADVNVLQERYADYFTRVCGVWERYLNAGLLVREGNRVRVSEDGWLISDTIFSDLFIV